jgi:hypothetical protein
VELDGMVERESMPGGRRAENDTCFHGRGDHRCGMDRLQPQSFEGTTGYKASPRIATSFGLRNDSKRLSHVLVKSVSVVPVDQDGRG